LVQIGQKENSIMRGSTFLSLALTVGLLFLAGCQPRAGNSNIAGSNSSANISNVNTANTNTSTASSAVSEAKEPDKYQAVVKLSFEALGDQQNATLPALAATVARNGGDRRMEFMLPTGEKVIYLDTAGGNYVILPNRRQYAELTKESLGFEVRQMLMPEQIVNRIKTVQGVEKVGEETVNGRKVIKYRYAASADTRTKAGQVGTESFLLIDAETGLPLHSETVSQSQSGGNVQGYKGVRLVTEMSDISMNPDPNLFTVPSDFAKIDPEQVKAQVTLIFEAAATLISQAVRQQTAAPAASPSVAR
jgi:hypothetical protein